jgi:hypothetical protein
MSSGGARAHSGPPPDPHALRRERDKAEWAHLPVAGRDAEAPAFPLTRPTIRERELWAEEWRRPQALMWEANGQARQVAMYVRTLAEAEKPRASTQLRNLVKQQEEILGISLTGLARNRWTIDHGPAAGAAHAHPSSSARARLLRAVPDAG